MTSNALIYVHSLENRKNSKINNIVNTKTNEYIRGPFFVSGIKAFKELFNKNTVTARLLFFKVSKKDSSAIIL